MALYEDFYEPCVLMEKKRITDGEGGWITKWDDGIGFEAAIVMDSTLQARVAESDGMTSVYTVTTPDNVKFDFHDVFKRLKDGKTFRVTSDPDDKTTPEVASFSFEQVTAEAWEIPSDN